MRQFVSKVTFFPDLESLWLPFPDLEPSPTRSSVFVLVLTFAADTPSVAVSVGMTPLPLLLAARALLVASADASVFDRDLFFERVRLRVRVPFRLDRCLYTT